MSGPTYLVLEFVDGAPLQGLDGLTADARAAGPGDRRGRSRRRTQRGVLHRDLKPANILVTARRRRLRRLDFGLDRQLLALASRRSISSDREMTSTLRACWLAPFAYMSPEQAEGKPLDTRSDVFSFGAVLYEMLLRRQAFDGSSTAQVLSVLLRDDPKPVQAAPVLGGGRRALSRKTPADRVRQREDSRRRWCTWRRGLHIRPSIAVLPFANMSPRVTTSILATVSPRRSSMRSRKSQDSKSSRGLRRSPSRDNTPTSAGL